MVNFCELALQHSLSCVREVHYRVVFAVQSVALTATLSRRQVAYHREDLLFAEPRSRSMSLTGSGSGFFATRASCLRMELFDKAPTFHRRLACIGSDKGRRPEFAQRRH
jgi:hypothetical protein